MNNTDRNCEEDRMDQLIYRAMLREGSIFPMTAEEVKQAKMRLQVRKSTLPAHLNSAAAVLEARGRAPVAESNVVEMPFNEFAEAKRELARAARNGKEDLSSRVEERMRLNRAKAKLSNA